MQQQCKISLPGNKEYSPAETFARMSEWCEQHQVTHDRYGEGELIQSFEKKVAKLLASKPVCLLLLAP